MMQQILRKLNNKGETITETLVGVIIMSLTMVVIAGAVVTSARINARVGAMPVAAVLGTVDKDGSGATITTSAADKKVNVYSCSVTRTTDDGSGSSGASGGTGSSSATVVNEDITSVTKASSMGKATVSFSTEEHSHDVQGETIKDYFYYYEIK